MTKYFRSIVFGALAMAALTSHAGIAAATPSQCDAIADNLVENCGFEAGTQPASVQPLDWTFTPAPSGSDAGVASGDHTGIAAYGFFGGGASDDEISQSIATVAGDQYAISFWINPHGNPETDFSAAFGADTLVSLTDPTGVTDPANNNYEQFSFDEIASSNSELLAFFGRDVPQNYELDDVSVLDLGPTGTTPVPEPTSLALLVTAFVSLTGLRRRTRRHAPHCPR